MPEIIRTLAYQAFRCENTHEKIQLVYQLDNHSKSNKSINPNWQVTISQLNTPPGYPPLNVVHPARVPKRGFHTLAGQAALAHAIAHIEFNAINLALDAVWRFSSLPERFYLDWLEVAVEEAQHFQLLAPCLAKRGIKYGDLAVHEGLWEMAEKTQHNVLERMALVPRVLEARGLDVTPDILQKLKETGPQADASDLVNVLKVILKEEEGHVKKGNFWFLYFCKEVEIKDPHEYFMSLCAQHNVKPPRPPFNKDARLACGFTLEELHAYQKWYQHLAPTN